MDPEGQTTNAQEEGQNSPRRGITHDLGWFRPFAGVGGVATGSISPDPVGPIVEPGAEQRRRGRPRVSAVRNDSAIEVRSDATPLLDVTKLRRVLETPSTSPQCPAHLPTAEEQRCKIRE